MRYVIEDALEGVHLGNGTTIDEIFDMVRPSDDVVAEMDLQSAEGE